MDQLREVFPTIDPTHLDAVLTMTNGDADMALQLIMQMIGMEDPPFQPSKLSYTVVGNANDLPRHLSRIGRRGWLSQLPYMTPDDDLEAVTSVLRTEYSGEFCVACCFDVHFVTRLIKQGFLTMCERIGSGDSESSYILLPKMHTERCVLDFANLHIEKNARKRSRMMQISVDQNFDDVFDALIDQHGQNWLHPPLRKVFGQIHRSPEGINGVKMHTFEVRDRQGKLVAGELGTAVGGCYTALSGFCSRDAKSCGTIQMVCAAHLLQANGFAFMDMGMPIEYKAKLGAKTLPREEFLSRFFEAREHTTISLPAMLSQCAYDVLILGSAEGEAAAEAEFNGNDMVQKSKSQLKKEAKAAKKAAAKAKEGVMQVANAAAHANTYNCK